MATYLVHYTYIGNGVMKVNAKNKNEAQDCVDNKSEAELLMYCNFDDGLGVDFVEPFDIEKIILAGVTDWRAVRNLLKDGDAKKKALTSSLHINY